VKTNAKESRVESIDESTFVVHVDERPVQGRANKRLLEILSDYFNLPKSKISIIHGATSTEKIIELEMNRQKQ